MITEDHQRVLKLMGVDLKDGRSRALRAIIISQEKLGSGCTFDELRTKMLEESGSKEIARPLIYRYLKSLEEDNLLFVERDSTPNRYIVDVATLSRGFNQIVKGKLAGLESRQEKLQQTKTSLSSIDASWFARDLIEMLIEGPFVSGSRSTRGRSQIQDLVVAEIYSRARKGDLLRMTLDWDFKSSSGEEKKRAIGYSMFSKGVKMRFLLHDIKRVEGPLLQDRINEYRKIRSNQSIKRLAETRVTFKTTKTYQCISLNRDGIVLIVSEDPYTGVWVPRTANSKLVDDVIDSFDEDFESGIDLLEIDRGR